MFSARSCLLVCSLSLSALLCNADAAENKDRNRSEVQRRSGTHRSDIPNKVHRQIKELEERVKSLEQKVRKLSPVRTSQTEVELKLEVLKQRIAVVKEQINKLSREAPSQGAAAEDKQNSASTQSVQAEPLDREETIILETRPSTTSSPAESSAVASRKAEQTASKTQQTVRRFYRIPTGYVPLLPSVPVTSPALPAQTQIIRGTQTSTGQAVPLQVYSTAVKSAPGVVSSTVPQLVTYAPRFVSAPVGQLVAAPQLVTVPAPQLVTAPAPQLVTAPVTQIAVPTTLRFRYTTTPVIYRYRY